MWIDGIAAQLPGNAGIILRRIWVAKRVAKLGAGATIETGTFFRCGNNISLGESFTLLRGSILGACDGKLTIGDRVSINSGSVVDASAGGNITIHNDALIGPNVVIRASNHAFDAVNVPMNRQGHTGGRIIIEEDVWIGANATIVPGVTIGAHAVVGAGAVVTQNVEPWTIVGGVPARLIRNRRPAASIVGNSAL